MHSPAVFLLNPQQLLEIVYIVTGLVLLVFAFLTFSDKKNPRRFGSGLFWLLLAIIFAVGGKLPHFVTGLMVIVMAALDGLGRVTRGDYNEPPKSELLKQAKRLGDKIFLPVLIIPLVTFALAILFRFMRLDVSTGALIGLVLGSIIAMVVCLGLTGSSVYLMMNEGRRLNDAMGTVSILPQLLASLGVIFTAAKIGDLIAGGIGHIIPANNLFLLVLANCL